MTLLGTTFSLRLDMDQKGGDRVFMQVVYSAPCSKTGVSEEWKGRKFYLSEHMLEQEIIFTAYLAFELAIKHEVMEGFRVDNTILVNPHVDYKKLLEISHNEVKREARVIDEETGVVLI